MSATAVVPRTSELQPAETNNSIRVIRENPAPQHSRQEDSLSETVQEEQQQQHALQQSATGVLPATQVAPRDVNLRELEEKILALAKNVTEAQQVATQLLPMLEEHTNVTATTKK